MFRKRKVLAPVLAQVTQRRDAAFMGWQKTPWGESFALYNITAVDHPSFGSTVTEGDLHKLNLKVPGAPLPQGPVKKPWS